MSPDRSTLAQRLSRARTPDQVLTAIRGYLFMVPPEDVASLPGGCAELCVQDGEALRRWAGEFARAAASNPGHAELRALEEALAVAASRYQDLAAAAPRAEPRRIGGAAA